MAARRVTLTVPADLLLEADPFRNEINLSAILTSALRVEVARLQEERQRLEARSSVADIWTRYAEMMHGKLDHEVQRLREHRDAEIDRMMGDCGRPQRGDAP